MKDYPKIQIAFEILSAGQSVWPVVRFSAGHNISQVNTTKQT